MGLPPTEATRPELIRGMPVFLALRLGCLSTGLKGGLACAGQRKVVFELRSKVFGRESLRTCSKGCFLVLAWSKL